jgi:aspartate carbamoyltransferase catalytic subunit
LSDTLTTSPAGLGEAVIPHLIDASQLEPSLILTLLRRAEELRQPDQSQAVALRGKIMATLFYEPSTRTRLSFESAMLRLGGQVMGAQDAARASSAAKGESLEDTVRVVGGYADIIVLRHPEIGAAERAARVSDVPLINAGDGAGQHPTQALLDLLTIKLELGRLDNLRIGLVGDLKHGRTVRSLSVLLSHFPGNELVLIAPPELAMGEDVLRQLQGRVRTRQESDLSASAGSLDVLYQTRIQAERFSSREDYERLRGVYVVDEALMRRLPEHAIVLHPLPRLDEIDPGVDTDPRAAYFRQAKNGVYMRMALLQWLLGAG